MKITIIGGGMAGWMTASYLKKNNPTIDITLIEDPAISKTLVGESIAPTVTDFIFDLGIDEKDFIKSTNASYKLGSKFSNFTNLDKDSDYVSININFSQSKLLSKDPITLQDFINDPKEIVASDLLLELIKRKELKDFIRYWSPHYSYMKKNVGFDSLFKNKKFILDKSYARSLHINAETTAEYIRDKVAIPLGVEHIQASVKEVVLENNTVKLLELANGTTVKSDLFVDCTGSARILVNKLNWKIKYFTDNKIDRAVVCQLAYEDKETELVNYTDITAGPHGWMFRIPLYHRMGCGYCFSSEHVSEEDAISYYMSKTKNHMFTPKVIRWTPNRLEKVADGNVIAIGMSAGFIEPLEANALRIVTTTIKNLEQAIRSPSLDFTKLNRNVTKTIDNFAFYILTFHTLSQRIDTNYWKYMTDIGIQQLHKQVVYKNYIDEESSAMTMFVNNAFLTLDQHWLQVYLLQNEERNLDSWELPKIDDNVLELAKQYFVDRYNYLDQLSSNEVSYNTWLTTNFFKS
jgi:tryptophan halogenase